MLINFETVDPVSKSHMPNYFKFKLTHIAANVIIQWCFWITFSLLPQWFRSICNGPHLIFEFTFEPHDKV